MSALATALFAQFSAAGGGVAGGKAVRIAAGQFTTVTATDTVATGLATVLAAIASFESDIGINPGLVQAEIGNQTGTPPAGSIIIKTWQFTSTTNPTPIAATTFSKIVSWVAFGT